MLQFPNISPIAFSIAGFDIYWYGLAYVATIFLGAKQCKYYAKKYYPKLVNIEDAIPLIVLGILIGGRLGCIVFYDIGYYLSHPLEMLKRSGMAFHGGLIGAFVGVWLFSRKIEQPLLSVTDIISAPAPLAGIFIRLANFINGELYGRPTSVAWGMIFPRSDGQIRHPSQLYEMFFEGMVLYIVTNIVYIKFHKMRGIPTGIAVLLYGIFRFIVEFFREPDGMVWVFTKGQFLCIPMIILGFVVIYSSTTKNK
ncbi:MAG: prolipoprotein diacylglyceryl transferase [Alphaproteobacteria bacterium]|nr:MAG: prolipoprotein diacylglyceryl transferase [Alphaproteobacteria bacterium]